MNKISTQKLADIIKTQRDKLNITQLVLSEKTGINRAIISRIEKENFIPSIRQLESLAENLDFGITDLLTEDSSNGSLVALRSETLSDSEAKAVDELFSMMIALRQQIVLRSASFNESEF